MAKRNRFNTLALFNPKFSYGNDYNSNESSIKDKTNLFNVIESNNLVKTNNYLPYNQVGVGQAFNKKESYSVNKVVENLNTINKVTNSNSGFVYMFDTETLGSPKAKGVANDIFMLTEVSLYKQKYENGKAVGKKILVNNFTAGIDHKELSQYVNTIKHNGKMDSTLTSTLQRVAGYIGGFDEYGNVKEHIANVDVSNTSVINEAIGILGGKKDNRGRIISNGPMYIRSTTDGKYNDDFVKGVMGLYNDFLKASKEENSIIMSMNGDAFDVPMISAFFKQYGIDVDGDLFKNHIDLQKLMKQTIESDVNQYIKKAKKLNPDLDIKETLQVGDLYKSLTAKGIEINLEDDKLHVALKDTAFSLDVFEGFREDLLNAENVIATQIKSNKVNSGSYFHADRAYVSESGERHFTTYAGKLNSYNSSILKANHTYKMESFKIGDAKDVPEELKDMYEEIKDKKIVKFTDAYYDDARAASYMIFDNNEQIQEKLFDSGILWGENILKKGDHVEAIKRSTEIAMNDSYRRNVQNYQRVNSNKGYSTFKTFLDQYEDLSISDIGKEQLLNLINNGKVERFGTEGEEDINEVLTRLSNEKSEGKVIKERLDAFVDIYDDIDLNYEFYKKVDDSIQSGINTSYIKSVSGLTDKQAENIAKTKKTQAFGDVMTSIKEEALDLLGDEEILDSYISSNSDIQEILDRKIANAKKKRLERINSRKDEGQALAVLGDVKLNSNDYLGIKKSAVSEYLGERYSKEAAPIVNHIFGNKPLELNYKTVMGLDVLNSTRDGYTSLSMRNSTSFRESISSLVNMNINSANGLKPPTETMRRQYVEDIAIDLYERGFVNNKELKNVINSETSSSKILNLADSVFERKNYATELIKKASNIKDENSSILLNRLNYSKLDKKEAKFLKSYLNNRTVKDLYEQNNVFTIMGQDIDSFFGDRLGREVESIGGFNVEVDPVLGIIENSIQRHKNGIVHYGDMSLDKDNISNATIKNILKEDLKWTDENVETFYKKVLQNKDLKGFKYNKGYNANIEYGMVSSLLEKDNDYYFFMAPGDKSKLLMDKLARDTDLEELQKYGVAFKLPKVEEIAGIRAVMQTDSSAKAVTKDMTMVSYKDLHKAIGEEDVANVNVSVYKNVDTIDQVLSRFGNNMKYIKGFMQDKNIERANGRAARAWQEINEHKNLTSVTNRVMLDKNGEVVIKRVLGANRSDMGKRQLYNISPLMYSIDLLESSNPELHQKAVDSLGDTYYKSINEVIQFKNSNEPYKFKGFDEWDTGMQQFFYENLGEISSTLLNDEDFMRYNSQIKEELEIMAKKGSSLAFMKESGEASSGYIYLGNVAEDVAASRLSGISRPLLNQVLSAPNIYEDDMLLLAQRELPKHITKNINNIDDLYNTLKIKANHGLVTQRVLDFTDELYDLNGKALMGFSTTTAKMNSETFLKRSLNIANDEKVVNDIINRLSKNGINNVTKDEVLRMARKLTDSSSVFEDSALVSPLLAYIMPPQTVTTQKTQNIDMKKFKLNSYLNTGDIIGYDSDNTPIRYKNNRAKIVNVEDGKLTLQLNDKYRSFKVGSGGSEKMELHVPWLKNDREISIYDAVFKHVSNDANIIANPTLGKHDAFNTLLPGYLNAISNNISTQEEADYVNEVFKKHIPNQDISLYKSDKDRRWMFVEQPVNDTKTNSLKRYEDAINEIKGWNKNIADDISNIEVPLDNGGVSVGWADFVKMQDNTIESVQGATNIGRGASISLRGQNVLGEYIGDTEGIDFINLYKENHDGKMVNIFDSLINEQNDIILSDNLNQTRLKQASNIEASLRGSLGMENPNAIYKDFKLEDALLGGSTIEADQMPKIFTLDNVDEYGRRVNAYKIDLSEMNLSVKNPLYSKNFKNGRENVSERLSEVYIPALMPNGVDGEYTLSRVQRKAADFLTNIYQIKSGTYNDSYSNMLQKVNNSYADLLDAQRWEMTHKDGLYKKALSAKMPFSSRDKVMKVAVPVLDENKNYLDPTYNKLSNAGKNKYKLAVEVNQKTFADMGLKMDTVGKQLFIDDIDDTGEAFNVIKKVFTKNKISMNNANNIEEAKKVLSKHINNNKLMTEIGITYLEDVGVAGLVMRDPAMKYSSFQGARVHLNNTVTQGMISMDSVLANLINADGDGDEINTFLTHTLFKDSNGSVKIRNKDSESIKSLNKYADIHAKNFNQEFLELASNYKDKIVVKENETHILNSYRKNIEKAFEGFEEKGVKVRNEAGELIVDYFENEVTNSMGILSRLSKASVGQVSNPNYYLNSAASAVFSTQGDNPFAIKERRALSVMTDLAEQKLIDVKSISTSFPNPAEASNAMLKIVGNYRSAMDNMGSASLEKQKQGVRSMIATMGMVVDDELLPKGITKDMIKDEASIAANAELIDEVVKRILNGDYNTVSKKGSYTLEEMIGVAYKVLNDSLGNKVFWDKNIRQQDISRVKNENIDAYDRILRVLDMSDEDYNRDLLIKAKTENFLQDNVVLNNRSLNAGNKVYTTKSNPHVAEGIYEVLGNYRNGSEYSVALKDMTTNEVTNINGSSFLDLGEKLDGNLNFVKDFKNEAGQPKLKGIEDEIVNRISLNKQKEVSSNYYNFIHGKNRIKELEGSKAPMSLEDKGLIKAFSNFNNSDLEDLLLTTEALKVSHISQQQANDFIASMNESIRNKGTKSYRELKKEKLMNMDVFATVPKGQFDTYIQGVVNKNKDTIINNTSIKSAKEQLANLNRINIDKVALSANAELSNIIKNNDLSMFTESQIGDGINSVVKNIRNVYAQKDGEIVNSINNIYQANYNNLNFQEEVLNWNLNEVKDLLKNNKTTEAVDKINSSKIAFGEHIGRNIGELRLDQLESIMKSSSDENVNAAILKNKEIVQQAIDLSKMGARSVSEDTATEVLSDTTKNSMKESLIENINNNIREKGQKTKTKPKTSDNAFLKNGKSLIEGISSKWSSMPKDKKMLVGGAIAAGVFAMAYNSGSSSMSSSKKQKRAPLIDHEKENNRGNSSPNGINQAPPSERKVYASNNGALNMKISGRAPIGTRPDHASGIVSGLFDGNQSVNVRSNISDNRNDISDREIENRMSKATWY